MSARERFTIGARVTLSEEGAFCLLPFLPRPVFGTVAGFGVYADVVRVQVDGRKQPVSYHHEYWTVVQEARAADCAGTGTEGRPDPLVLSWSAVRVAG